MSKLQRSCALPTLALAVKAAAVARMTGTLMETYLGRDAGQRVLSGRIMRGVADRIDAVMQQGTTLGGVLARSCQADSMDGAQAHPSFATAAAGSRA